MHWLTQLSSLHSKGRQALSQLALMLVFLFCRRIARLYTRRVTGGWGVLCNPWIQAKGAGVHGVGGGSGDGAEDELVMAVVRRRGGCSVGLWLSWYEHWSVVVESRGMLVE